MTEAIRRTRSRITTRDTKRTITAPRSTTSRALEQQPVAGGEYRMTRPRTRPSLPPFRCDVIVDGNRVRIETDNGVLVLAYEDARTLLEKLGRTLK